MRLPRFRLRTLMIAVAVAVVAAFVTMTYLAWPRAGEEGLALIGVVGLGLTGCLISLPFVAYWLVLGRGDSPPPE